MPSSDAERSRRHRRHNAGDHSLCILKNCAAAGQVPGNAIAEPRPTRKREAPAGLGATGTELWDAVVQTSNPGPLQTQLLVEACRIADRLDTLDVQLRGGSWLRFRHDESGAEVTVYVDRVLAEAREQATTLRGLVQELTKSTGALPGRGQHKTGGGGVADLTARLAARRPPASG